MLLKLFSEGGPVFWSVRIRLPTWFPRPEKHPDRVRKAGVSEKQVILLCEGLIKDQKKLQELLTFGIRFEGVIQPNPALCSTIRAKLDIENECRIVLDESRMYDNLNFSGYVVKYDYPPARPDHDRQSDCTNRNTGKSTSAQRKNSISDLFRSKTGVIQPEIRTNSKQGERIP